MENCWGGLVKSDVNFWHMNCIKNFMARKMNSLKLALEVRGNAAVTDRRPETQMAALYLMQARSSALEIATPRRRLRVVMDAETRAETEYSIKIIHAG
jgi:hypothetical protein